jgi:hypothetical protein
MLLIVSFPGRWRAVVVVVGRKTTPVFASGGDRILVDDDDGLGSFEPEIN